ncbi:MAG: lipopolysaccharide biosynthesis protein [Gammaproteobacteria bacterium]
MANLREKTVKGVIWSALQNTIGPLISFAVFLVLARLIEPAAFGQLALATVAVNFCQLFLSGGFGSAIVQRQILEPQHLDTAFWVSIGGAIVLITVVIGSAELISDLFAEPGLAPIIQWLSIMLLIDAMTQVQTAQLRRNMAFRSLALRSLVAEPIGGAVGVTMALAGFGVWSLVSRNLVTSLCKLLVLWLASDWRPGFRTSKKHFDDLFYFGASMVGTNFVNFFSRRSDTLLIGYFLGSTALGYYNVGYRLFLMMTEMIGGTINNVAWPLFSRLQNDLPRLREAFYTATRLVCLLACPIFLGIFAVTPELVPIVFGEKWVPSIPVMQILAFIGLLRSLFFFNESVIVSVGKPQWRLFLQIAVAVTNVLGFFLVVRWGIVAVAAVYVIVGYAFAPASLWMVKRLIGIEFWTYFGQYRAPILASGAMLIMILVMERRLSDVWNGSPWFLGTLIAAGAMTYFVTVYWLSPSTVTLITTLIKDLGSQKKNRKAEQQLKEKNHKLHSN